MRGAAPIPRDATMDESDTFQDDPSLSLDESLKRFMAWQRQKQQVLERHAESATEELANAPRLPSQRLPGM